MTTLFIEPGSPWEKGYIESFNGKLRDELLNREVFTTAGNSHFESGIIIGGRSVLRARVSRPILERLVRVGALDALGDRDEMLSELPRLAGLSQKSVKGARPLIEDAHTGEGSIEANHRIDRKASMLAERELLSLDLSAHPLDFYPLDDGFTRIEALPLVATGDAVKIAGSVIRYQTPPTRNGNRVVYVIMEDGTGVADVTVFGDVQERCGPVLFREGWLVVEGKVQRRGPKALSIIAENLAPLTLW